MSSHTSVTQQAVSSSGQLYENVRRGKEGGRKEEKLHRKESATQRLAALITVGLCWSLQQDKERKKRQMVGEKGAESKSEGERGGKERRGLPHFVNSLFISHSTLVLT